MALGRLLNRSITLAGGLQLPGAFLLLIRSPRSDIHASVNPAGPRSRLVASVDKNPPAKKHGGF